jgi:succinylglutamate desuccinylase
VLSRRASAQNRKTAGHPWQVVTSLTTATKGTYHTTITVTTAATWYMVAWLGATRSAIPIVKRWPGGTAPPSVRCSRYSRRS